MASAIEETTKLLLHEIEPILGAIRLHAEKEITSKDSETLRQLERLDQLLGSIGTLSQAAAAPKSESIDLHELLDRLCTELSVDGVEIDLVGRRPLVIESDSGLISIAFMNGLKNGIEATLEPRAADIPTEPITVAWGDSDRDIWVSVVDRGPGILPGLERVWDIGSSTKPGHLGMGLSLARRAVRSLGGDVSLTPRDEGGARFEMRWPRIRESSG
ncbi:MAG TPA: HAMP domain-containing sensor histidine kinase [Planctomycetota bacterium]|nr:HAMP domain-containing sensor histidine kinase [Planctomycetota bacterium]